MSQVATQSRRQSGCKTSFRLPLFFPIFNLASAGRSDPCRPSPFAVTSCPGPKDFSD
uniref:Uncharacterized protein n=1 Tax=Leersia perrieri TaxID=77586 RepID=A0A0D9XJ16_9ORYZ